MRSARVKLTLAALTTLLVLIACDSDSSRTSGTVTDLPPGRLCFLPEDSDQTDLRGCFPLADDASQLQVGDCISVVIPNYLDPEIYGEQIRSIRLLDRECHEP